MSLQAQEGELRAGSNFDPASERKKFASILSEGDREAADALINRLLALGIRPEEIYSEVVIPGHIIFGDHWHKNSLTVCEEHRGTCITVSTLGRLRSKFEKKRQRGQLVVVTAVEGDVHDLGARMIGDFLYADGYDVDFLGANSPTDDLILFVKKRKPSLVVISVTVPELINNLNDSIRMLKEAVPSVKVMVGGAALSGVNNSSTNKVNVIGADAVAKDIKSALGETKKILSPETPEQELEQLLGRIGATLRFLRKEKKMSQREVSDAAGLDRTYLSAVENGKQNITLGALIKLASALDVELQYLMFGMVEEPDGQVSH
jgi:methanogenic corrinoid protein MtbC1/DNA-binding XRE family transcriptional regulator